PAGDLDGDGRGELLIDRLVVPGSVPLGSHLVADVAVELPGNRVLPAGDGVGDASFDLLVGSGGGAGARTHLVDGRTVVASGPGSRLTDLGPVTLPGVPASVFDVGSGSPAYAVVSDG